MTKRFIVEHNMKKIPLNQAAQYLLHHDEDFLLWLMFKVHVATSITRDTTFISFLR